MRLAVIGSGYVGLVAGAGFADFGNEVTCADTDAEKIAGLARGKLPIYEPGLDRLVEHNMAEGRLSFTTDIAAAVGGAEAIFIAVGTPPAEDGSADLKHVVAAAEAVGRALTGWAVIVNKSTVPVGTSEKVRQAVSGVTDVPFAVASNPEFLKEGDAINDFMKPDRIIVGTDDDRAREVLRSLYAPFVRTNDRIILMDTRSAELTKYAANAMLATRISFMNEMANLCERLGADVEALRRGLGMDPRIGAKFLFPGVGYGGSCFPKDVRALLQTASSAGARLEVIEAVHRANERQKAILFEKISGHFGGKLRGRTIALWGLAFKPGTDDMREAPSLVMVDRLVAAGAKLRLYDPVAMPTARAMLAAQGEHVTFHDNGYDAAQGADALVLLTEWHEFRRPNFPRLRQLLAGPNIFDGRNVWNPTELRGMGFTYFGIGRR